MVGEVGFTFLLVHQFSQCSHLLLYTLLVDAAWGSAILLATTLEYPLPLRCLV